MQLDCDDGTSGFVKDDEKPSSITVTVVDGAGNAKSYSVSNPPRGMRAYYASPAENPFIKSALAKQGVVLGGTEKVSVNQATYQKSPQLYEDSEALKPKGGGAVNSGSLSDANAPQVVAKKGDPPTTSKGPQSPSSVSPSSSNDKKANVQLHCVYNSSPVVLSGASCGESLCTASVTCFRNGKKAGSSGLQAACKASSAGHCPSATACASDKKVKLANASSYQQDSGDAQKTNSQRTTR